MATSFTTHSAGQVIASADINLIQTAVNAAENNIDLTGLLTGSGVPSAGLGNNTNLYLDTATGIIYRKTAGSWAAIYTPSGGGGGSPNPAAVHGFSGWAYDPVLVNASNFIPTVGQLNFVKIAVPATTINAIVFWCTGVVGSSVTAALYTSAGALLSQSTAVASNVSGAIVCTLGAAQAVSAGNVYIGVWSTGTAFNLFSENVGGALNNGLGNVNVTAPNLRYGTTNNTGLTTTAPSTLGTQAATNASVPWCAVK